MVFICTILLFNGLKAEKADFVKLVGIAAYNYVEKQDNCPFK